MKYLLTTLFLCCTATLFANSFYISNYQVYSTDQEAQFTYYNYNYRGNKHQDLGSPTFALYRVSDLKHFFGSKMMIQYGNSVSDSLLKTYDLIKVWDHEGALNQYNQQINLGKLDEGVYVIEAIRGSDMAQIPLIVSDYALILRNTGAKAVTFMSNRKSGKGVRGYKAYAHHNNETLHPLYYKNSTAVFDMSSAGNQYYYNMPVVALKGDQVAVSQAYFYNYYNQGNRGTKAYIFTDRSAYRPEQWVKFKGVFRDKEGFGYKVHTDSVAYVIYNGNHEEIARKRVALDRNGTFTDSIFTEQSWKLGEYTIQYNNGGNNYYWYYGNNKKLCRFKLEEYKKPEYEVSVDLDKTQYRIGQKIEAEISADYFFGAPVTNATVQYKVVSENFYVPWYYSYRYWWWYEDLYGSDYYNYGGQQVIHHGTGELDKEGKLKFEYMTDGKNQQNYKYTVIAEVTDASRRVITGSSNAIVAYTSFTISANSQKYYYNVDENIRVDVSTLDFSRQRLETPVRAKIYRYNYDNHWRRTDKKLVLDTTMTTSTDMAETLVIPEQDQGYYLVELEAADEDDHKVTSQISAYVVDPKHRNYYWWNNGNYGGIQIMTDKKVYKAGETIHAVLYVPHETDALITVNNQEFAHFDNYTFSAADDKGAYRTLDIPVDKEAYGRMEVFVGYNHQSQYYAFKQDVSIIPDNKYLNVSIEFDENEYRPGKFATAKVKVTDNKGRPVPGADVTLATADEAIYSLYPDMSVDIGKHFYNIETHNYYFNYQNQFSRSASSTKMTVNGLEMRRKKLDMNFEQLSYLNKNQWYHYSFHQNKAPSASIRGYVVDNKSGKVIPNAGIQVGKRRIKANSNGYFAMTGFKLSHTTITFDHNGKKTVLKNLGLYKDHDMDLVVAISNKENKEVVFNNNPEITALLDNRRVDNAELDMLEDEVALEESEAMDVSTVAADSDGAFGGGLSRSSAAGNAAAPAMAGEMKKSGKLKQDAAKGPMSEKDLAGEQQKMVEPEKTRSDFQDAIYWNPHLTTNYKGEAKVRIKLPDNLTTWRTFAKVITPNTEVGQAMAKIVVTKNLLVRMETPRFITLGDEMLIATTVHNYLAQEKDVTIELQANGLSVEGTRKKIRLEANDDKRVDWKISTRYITEAGLTVKALTNEESDAMELKVPVQPYGLEMVEASSMYLTNLDEDEMSLTIPSGVNLNSASVELSTAPSVTAALLTSMDDLIGYPYGCVEQTMSRFLPNVIVAQTIDDLGNDYASTIDPEELKKMVAQGTKRLGQLQHSDGGWGWWENDQTNPFMTAYVVNGLYMATQAGYEIPSNMLDQGKTALSQIIRSKKYESPTTYAYAMMVGVKTGMKDLWKGKKLPDSDKADAYELSLWLQAAHFAQDKEVGDKMAKYLEKSVIEEGTVNHWGGKKFYYSWRDDQVETTANAVLGLSLYNDEHPMIPGAVQWLMNQRKGNSWHNTRQTAMTIFGLNRVIKKDANPNLELEIFANGVLLETLNYDAKDVFKKGATFKLTAMEFLAATDLGKMDKNGVLQYGKNVISVKQKGKGSLFVNAKLKYFLDGKSSLTEEQKKKMKFKVSREYYKLIPRDRNGRYTYVKEKLSKHEIKSGDNVLVKVKVHSDNAQEYVLIEDPIPAGCEFIRDPKGYIIEGESLYNGSDQYWNRRYWGYWNWNRWYSHREYRDSKISHTITRLPSGDYEYTYLLKAQIPGSFKVNPAVAQLMYYPENRGFSDFGEFNILSE